MMPSPVANFDSAISYDIARLHGSHLRKLFLLLLLLFVRWFQIIVVLKPICMHIGEKEKQKSIETI